MSGKNPELNAQHQKILRELLKLPENRSCADCHSHGPRWASTNLGVFICIDCSGFHRKMGTHISQVRSTTLDTWTPAQIETIQKLGNGVAKDLYEKKLPQNFQRPSPKYNAFEMERFIRDKYERGIYRAEGSPANPQQSTTTAQPPPPPSSSQPQQQQPYRQNYPSNNLPQRGLYGGPPEPPRTPGISYQSSSYSAHPQRPTGGQSPYAASNNPYAAQTSTSTFTSASAGGAAAMIAGGKRVDELAKKKLMDMGFTADVATQGLQKCGGNIQQALDWCLNNASAQKSQQQPSKTSKQATTQASTQHTDLLGDIFGSPTDNTTTTMTTEANAGTADDDFADFGAFTSFKDNSVDDVAQGLQNTSLTAPSTAPGTKLNALDIMSLYDTPSQPPSDPTSASAATAGGVTAGATSIPLPTLDHKNDDTPWYMDSNISSAAAGNPGQFGNLGMSSTVPMTYGQAQAHSDKLFGDLLSWGTKKDKKMTMAEMSAASAAAVNKPNENKTS